MNCDPVNSDCDSVDLFDYDSSDLFDYDSKLSDDLVNDVINPSGILILSFNVCGIKSNVDYIHHLIDTYSDNSSWCFVLVSTGYILMTPFSLKNFWLLTILFSQLLMIQYMCQKPSVEKVVLL